MILANPNRVGGQWIKMAPLKYACSNPCLLSFQNRCLIKFGGLFEAAFPKDYFIEVYLEDVNEWFPVNTKIPSFDPRNYVLQNHVCDTFASGGFQKGLNEVIIVGGLNSSLQRS